MEINLSKKISKATKWSSLTEIFSKIISPFTTIILARLLDPTAFGAIATITMIITFTKLFTDAGFQKFIIYYEFDDNHNKKSIINVAFTVNIFISFALWFLIIIFKDPIAFIVGNLTLEML